MWVGVSLPCQKATEPNQGPTLVRFDLRLASNSQFHVTSGGNITVSFLLSSITNKSGKNKKQKKKENQIFLVQQD